MFYIQMASCISAQQSFTGLDIDTVKEAVDGKLLAIEPNYDGIPPAIFRRMGKAVRMGAGAAMPLLKNTPQPAGIIIGTANGGKEDAVKFMNQIVEYNEGLLTPINFVQSTPNAIAAQIGLLTKNYGYNITHVHLGLAFEMAMIDAGMLIAENPVNICLLGAVDDISSFNYNFEEKYGYHKKERVASSELYHSNTPGNVAGEAAVMFMVSSNPCNALVKVVAVDTLHTESVTVMEERLRLFINTNLPAGEAIDLLLTGENGDNRLQPFYNSCESLFKDGATIARYKHMSGEFCTATAMGLWLCCKLSELPKLPIHMIKKEGDSKNNYKNILIYNTHRGIQHSFILVSVITA